VFKFQMISIRGNLSYWAEIKCGTDGQTHMGKTWCLQCLVAGVRHQGHKMGKPISELNTNTSMNMLGGTIL
jgi:hypothetical protein